MQSANWHKVSVARAQKGNGDWRVSYSFYIRVKSGMAF